jgi:hypothetical protein
MKLKETLMNIAQTEVSPTKMHILDTENINVW